MSTYNYLCFFYVLNLTYILSILDVHCIIILNYFELLLHLKGVESLTKEIEVKFLICRSLRSVIDPQCLWF